MEITYGNLLMEIIILTQICVMGPLMIPECQYGRQKLKSRKSRFSP